MNSTISQSEDIKEIVCHMLYILIIYQLQMMTSVSLSPLQLSFSSYYQRCDRLVP